MERPRIIQAIAEARAHGDLSENAEYHAAREQQGFCEGRIDELEHELSHCQIIDLGHLPQTGKVVFGATVTWKRSQRRRGDLPDRRRARGRHRPGPISITSPIARALVGKSEGDEVQVAVPGGTRRYEIVTVRYV